MSLQDSAARPTPSKREVVVIDHDEDEEAAFQAQLQQAIDASRQEQRAENSISSTTSSTEAESSHSKSASNFLSERAKLEQERLARLKRLRHEPSTHTSHASTQHSDGEEDDDEIEIIETRDVKRQRISSSISETRKANARASVYSADPSRSLSTDVRSSNDTELFWDGEVRQTANKHVDPAKDTRPVFRLTNILSPVSQRMTLHMHGIFLSS